MARKNKIILKNTKKLFFISFQLGLIYLLIACQPTIKTKGKNMVVTSHLSHQSLFYSGVIQPLASSIVISPFDGAIASMHFQYGERVNKGQLLFKIASSKFINDYNRELMQYIKTKNEFEKSESEWKENNFLYRHGLISKDEYTNKQSNYYVNRLSFYQAKENIKHFIDLLKIENTQIENLSIADINKITFAMRRKNQIENLSIIAPVSGIILATYKNNDEDVKKISINDQVKEGEVLATIGDMNRFIIKIKVNELIINQLQVGQAVSITGIAFPDMVLVGHILQIDHQAEMGNAGLPFFTVQIIVPHLNLAQQAIIHPGMSAKVEIVIDHSEKIIVPISAITKIHNQYYAKKIKGRKAEWIVVKIGATYPEGVNILAGLEKGDKIILHD